MHKHFNRRNFIITLILDLCVGGLAGALIVNVVGPILGYTPSFIICGGVGLVVGMVIAMPFPWMTYPKEH